MKLQVFVLLLILSMTASQIFAQSWSLAKDKNGVKVYTRKINGWGIKEYKAKMTVKANLSTVIRVLKDVQGRYEWLHNTVEIREVERLNGDIITIYNKVDAPWPVADRDNITKFSFSYPSAASARIDMTVLKTHKKAPIYDGIVRVERLKGHWLLQDKGNGMVEIMQQCAAEPGGSIPDWLANSAVVDTPYNSMYKLKQYIEKG